MKILTILLIVATAFVFNIGIYYVSEDYRYFLKSIKSDEQNIEITDEYSITKEEIKETLENDLNEPLDVFVENERPALSNTWVENQESKESIAMVESPQRQEKKLEMSPYEKEMLFLFRDYNFTKLDSHGALFDLTTEYPDKYFEYYLPDLSLLFFSTKTYNEVKEIFEIVSDDWNFTLNEVDNFWEESFYINLQEWFDDWYIRLVFTKNWKVFGLKISKNEYTNVKNILKEI